MREIEKEKIEYTNEYFYTTNENILYNHKNEIVLKDYKKLDIHSIYGFNNFFGDETVYDVLIFQLIDNTYKIFVLDKEFFPEETIIDVKETEQDFKVFQITFANNATKYLHCEMFDVYETLDGKELK
jgi:hypothetical protein